MKYKLFLILPLLVLVLSNNSQGSIPPGIILPKDVPGDYPEPIEIRIIRIEEDGGLEVIQYSPDGKFLAAGGYFGIYLFNTQTREKVYQIKGNTGHTWCLAFSPDGKTLASGWHSSDTIHLWDVATGTHRDSIIVHRSTTYSLAFSPDGEALASGGTEGYFISDGQKVSIGGLHLWDANTGHLLHRLKGHERSVTGVAFSPDGKTLVSGSYDATLRFWDSQTGKPLRKITGRVVSEGVAFRPDGKKLVSWGLRGGIFIWDVETGNLLHNLKRVTTDTDDVLYSVAFSPDGKTLASASAAAFRLWDVSTGSYLHSLPKPRNMRPSSVAFSPDGKTLASAGRSGTILLWDITPPALPEDVNGDGIVNILDLVAVANAFGNMEPDLNGDGVVNIQDLVIVANAFGNTVAAQ